MKIKVGDRVTWKAWSGGYNSGTVEKIVPKDSKPVKVRPDSKHGFTQTLAAIKEKNILAASI